MRPYEDSFPLNRFIPSLRRLRVPAVQRCYQSRKVIQAILPSLDKEPLIAPRHLVRTHSVFYSETADSITAFCLYEDRALVTHTLYPRGFQGLVGGLASRGWGWWLGWLGQGRLYREVLGARGCQGGGLYRGWWVGFVVGWARGCTGAGGSGPRAGRLDRSHEFSWDPLIASLVKKEWQSKCARRLSGIASKVCTDPSYKATWCAPALRAHMKKIRQEDEDFKRRSSQCSKNRLQNESQRVHHRQGSISDEELKINMEKELARLSTTPELYYDGHVDNDGQFDEFQKKKAANLECEDETQKKSEDELFFEVVGGWNEKGRIFGLGAAAHSYYDRTTCEEKNGKKSHREYIKSLETHVVEHAAKNDDQQKELDQTKQELDQTKQELGETKQGLVDTQTNLVRTQQVLIQTKKNTGRNHQIFHDFQKTSRKVYAS
ncbi:GRAM domain-containing protein 4 [Bienertia sinuspersici]